VGTNSIIATSLAIISCIMGGGIVSIPYAFACVGFVNGLIIQACLIAAAMISTHLYLRSRKILASKYSFSDIAEKTIGKVSGILLSALIAVALFGVLILYNILFARIAVSVFGSVYKPVCINATIVPAHCTNSMWNKKWPYIFILALIETPIVMKRRL